MRPEVERGYDPSGRLMYRYVMGSQKGPWEYDIEEARSSWEKSQGWV